MQLLILLNKNGKRNIFELLYFRDRNRCFVRRTFYAIVQNDHIKL